MLQGTFEIIIKRLVVAPTPAIVVRGLNQSVVLLLVIFGATRVFTRLGTVGYCIIDKW